MFCPKCGIAMRAVKRDKDPNRYYYAVYACDNCEIARDLFIHREGMIKIGECLYYKEPEIDY